MKTSMAGHRYPPFRLKPDRALGEKFLRGQGIDTLPEIVPPTYMVFVRGETRGANLFKDLDIPRERALHGGQRYEWLAPIHWDDELDVTVSVEKVTEKQGKRGRFWIAEVALDYARVSDGTTVLREITRIIEQE